MLALGLAEPVGPFSLGESCCVMAAAFVLVDRRAVYENQVILDARRGASDNSGDRCLDQLPGIWSRALDEA